MKLSIHLFALLALALVAGCGSDTPAQSSTTPVDSSGGPGPIQNANQQVDCSGFPGTSACGDLCVYLLSEPQHCGSCDNACPAGIPCVSGMCTTCPANQYDCDGQCADLQSDPHNCGQCGNDCNGATCQGGVCTCPGGGMVCGGTCVSRDDPQNCGACGNACPALTQCTGGNCMCSPGLAACNGMCTDTMTDGANCGACGNDCAAQGMFCSGGQCSAQCPAGTTPCDASCVDTNTSLQHCGMCNNACAPGEACSAGSCGCAGATEQSCNGTCVDVMTHALNCGACGNACGAGETCESGTCSMVMTPAAGCAAGQEMCNGVCVTAGTCTSGGGGAGPVGGGGAGPVGSGGAPPVDANGCAIDPGMITSFESQTYDLLEQEGRAGLVDTFNDGTGTQTTTIEMDGTDPCNQYVLHTQGSGFSSWGAGVGSVFTGTWDAAANDGEGEYAPPAAGYDASKYTAISFRAKAGGNQKNPVRFNISIPATEGDPYGNGTCTDSSDVDNPCWNHLGQFLQDDEALTTQWQTFTFCFDRDLYPMFLPSHVTLDERNSVAKQLLKFQFQFNQSFDPSTAEQVSLTDSFDFYLDDIKFTNPASCDGTIFQSTGSASDAFGTNAAVGSCMPAANAAKFNKAITEAYARWKARFVGSDGGVMDPDENNRVVSEAIGYGMIITAAMGDKDTFDKIYGWAKGKGAPGSLIGWENGSGGSASDADTDIAFALMMAGKQWGGSYASDGGSAAGAALSGDVQGNLIRGGNQFLSVFNPSYFSPGFYRAFGGGWSSVISTTYSTVQSCASSFGGLVPDWCSPEGQAIGAAQTGAQQQAGEVCTDGNSPCLAFESARTPWRLGYDLCFDSQGQSLLKGMIDKLEQTDSTLANGARIDTIEAGWNSSGPLTEGVGNAMAFIGPLGVAGMGLNDSVLRDRAFRATLDIIERPEFYNTYYQTTLGMIALLTMSGNFPAP
jgi:hypothetical protein